MRWICHAGQRCPFFSGTTKLVSNTVHQQSTTRAREEAAVGFQKWLRPLSNPCPHRISRCMEAAASRSTLAAALRPAGVRKASTITSISLREYKRRAGGRVLNGTGREGWDEQQCTLCHGKLGVDGHMCRGRKLQLLCPRHAKRHLSCEAAEAHSLVDGQYADEPFFLFVHDNCLS